MARSPALLFLVATMAVAAMISNGVEGADPFCSEAEGCCICKAGSLSIVHLHFQIADALYPAVTIIF